MLMLTYEEYRDRLGGGTPYVTPDTYMEYYRQAEAELHLATFDRLRGGWAGFSPYTQYRVQAALVDLILAAAKADKLNADQLANPTIKSESVGAWSVSYDRPSSAGNAEIYGPKTAARIINLHLLHTGLLYRGDYEGGLPYDL